eukprot:884278_1
MSRESEVVTRYDANSLAGPEDSDRTPTICDIESGSFEDDCLFLEKCIQTDDSTVYRDDRSDTSRRRNIEDYGNMEVSLSQLGTADVDLDENGFRADDYESEMISFSDYSNLSPTFRPSKPKETAASPGSRSLSYGSNYSEVTESILVAFRESQAQIEHLRERVGLVVTEEFEDGKLGIMSRSQLENVANTLSKKTVSLELEIAHLNNRLASEIAHLRISVINERTATEKEEEAHRDTREQLRLIQHAFTEQVDMFMEDEADSRHSLEGHIAQLDSQLVAARRTAARAERVFADERADLLADLERARAETFALREESGALTVELNEQRMCANAAVEELKHEVALQSSIAESVSEHSERVSAEMEEVRARAAWMGRLMSKMRAQLSAQCDMELEAVRRRESEAGIVEENRKALKLEIEKFRCSLSEAEQNLEHRTSERDRFRNQFVDQSKIITRLEYEIEEFKAKLSDASSQVTAQIFSSEEHHRKFTDTQKAHESEVNDLLSKFRTERERFERERAKLRKGHSDERTRLNSELQKIRTKATDSSEKLSNFEEETNLAQENVRRLRIELEKLSAEKGAKIDELEVQLSNCKTQLSCVSREFSRQLDLATEEQSEHEKTKEQLREIHRALSSQVGANNEQSAEIRALKSKCDRLDKYVEIWAEGKSSDSEDVHEPRADFHEQLQHDVEGVPSPLPHSIKESNPNFEGKSPLCSPTNEHRVKLNENEGEFHDARFELDTLAERCAELTDELAERTAELELANAHINIQLEESGEAHGTLPNGCEVDEDLELQPGALSNILGARSLAEAESARASAVVDLESARGACAEQRREAGQLAAEVGALKAKLREERFAKSELEQHIATLTTRESDMAARLAQLQRHLRSADDLRAVHARAMRTREARRLEETSARLEERRAREVKEARAEVDGRVRELERELKEAQAELGQIAEDSQLRERTLYTEITQLRVEREDVMRKLIDSHSLLKKEAKYLDNPSPLVEKMKDEMFQLREILQNVQAENASLKLKRNRSNDELDQTSVSSAVGFASNGTLKSLSRKVSELTEHNMRLSSTVHILKRNMSVVSREVRKFGDKQTDAERGPPSIKSRTPGQYCSRSLPRTLPRSTYRTPRRRALNESTGNHCAGGTNRLGITRLQRNRSLDLGHSKFDVGTPQRSARNTDEPLDRINRAILEAEYAIESTSSEEKIDTSVDVDLPPDLPDSIRPIVEALVALNKNLKFRMEQQARQNQAKPVPQQIVSPEKTRLKGNNFSWSIGRYVVLFGAGILSSIAAQSLILQKSSRNLSTTRR